jgi:DNA-binding response OmpR family regulator
MALGNSSAAERAGAVLVVSPFEGDLRSLRGTLAPSNWTLYAATGGIEAMEILRRTSVPVILCESELPDGDWRDLLAAVAELQCPPLIIVTSQFADECLWAEVLNLGGYDVLAKPFDSFEVIWLMSMAWQRWNDEWRRGGGQPAMAREAVAFQKR